MHVMVCKMYVARRRKVCYLLMLGACCIRMVLFIPSPDEYGVLLLARVAVHCWRGLCSCEWLFSVFTIRHCQRILAKFAFASFCVVVCVVEHIFPAAAAAAAVDGSAAQQKNLAITLPTTTTQQKLTNIAHICYSECACPGAFAH